MRTDGLEIDQDLEFQRRSWAVQRVGWLMMALFVLAAAIGLLGSGPLSRTRAEVPGLMTVEYQRFARFETSETLTVRLAPAATAERAVRLSFNREFLDAAKVDSVLPAPMRVESAGGRLVYIFAVAEPRTPMAVRVHFEPREIGRYRGAVTLESVAEPRTVSFRQLVFP